MSDVTVVVNLHREGRIAVAALRSAQAAIAAAPELACEILVVLSCSAIGCASLRQSEDG